MKFSGLAGEDVIAGAVPCRVVEDVQAERAFDVRKIGVVGHYDISILRGRWHKQDASGDGNMDMVLVGRDGVPGDPLPVFDVVGRPGVDEFGEAVFHWYKGVEDGE